MSERLQEGGVASIVLAAGAGRRFGGRKQLAPLDGTPLLEHASRQALGAATDETVVVLGAFAEEVIAGVDLGGATVVVCEGWDEGRAASLRCGLEAVHDRVEAAVVTLGDEPLVQSAATDRLLAARSPETEALRATYAGRPGHPVLFEKALFARLLDRRLGLSPRQVLRQAEVVPVACDDLGAATDVDTPDQLARLRESIKAPGGPAPPAAA